MKPPAGPAIRLKAMGATQITTPRAVIEPSAELVFATALYLLLERRDVTPRRLLHEMLWPDASDETGSHRLRQTLFKLRKLGFPVESEGKSRLQLVATQVMIDYEEADLITTSSDFDQRLGQPILAGFEPLFSWRYAEWLDRRKAKITTHLTRVLLATIGRFRLAGNWSSVETLSRSLLQYSSDNEEATLALAEALAMRGDKIQGVKVLDNYLSDIGNGPSDLRLSATLMRRRIADRMPPRDHDVSGETPLFGRETFLELLAHQLATARASHSQPIIVWGAPGIGKSRLVNEFISFAALQGVAWHRVTCRSTDSARPLAVLLELIPLLRSMRGAIGSSPETLAFFDTLTKHVPKKSHSSHATPTDYANAGLDAAIADIFGAVTDETVLVIVVEDCHWMDKASATVFSRLVQRLTTQRLHLIFTTRVLHDGGLTDLAFDIPDMQLPGLNEEASTEILHAIIRQKGRQVSSEYVHWCTQVAEGNPFFLRELANHWLETGEEHAAPPSLTAILRQRLSRINSNSLQVLQTCALLENNSTIDNLEAVLAYPAHELMRSINDLASAGMIASEANDSHVHPSGRINSRHDLLSDVALMLLAPTARAYLHRRAAKVLEISIAEHGDASTLWSCAKHWQLAGDVSQAFRLAKSCATHLLEAGLPSEAAAAFEKAAEYCGSDADMLSVLQGQATAYYRSSDWKNVIGSIANVRSLRNRIGVELSDHDELELMELRAEWQTLNWNKILCRSLICLDAPHASAVHRVEAGAMALMMLSFQGDAAAAEEVFGKILETASDPTVHRAAVLQAMMVFHTNWGQLDEAVCAAFDLVEQNRAREDIGFLFRSLCNAAVTFRAAGRFDDASDHLREALDLAERHHLYLSKSRALPMLANMSLELGNIDDAKHWLLQLKQSTIATEDKLGHAEISAIGARIALLEGRYREAELLVDRDLAHMRDDQVPHRRAYVAALRVAVEMANDGKASVTSVGELEAAYLLSRKNLFQAFVTYALYVGLLSIGSGTRGEELLNEYIAHYRRESWPSPEHLLNSMLSLLRTDAKEVPSAARLAS